MYCEKCNAYFEQEACPYCGGTKSRAPHKDDPCFLTEREYIWARMLMDILKQNGIPYLEKSRLGAGVTARIGLAFESVQLYVPYSSLIDAQELVRELFAGNAQQQ